MPQKAARQKPAAAGIAAENPALLRVVTEALKSVPLARSARVHCPARAGRWREYVSAGTQGDDLWGDGYGEVSPAIPRQTRSARTVSGTSWTRRIWAPCCTARRPA